MAVIFMMPSRKKNRLEDYDYSGDGCYFVTICVRNREPLLWSRGEQRSPASNLTENCYSLSRIGKAVSTAINNITDHYPSVRVDTYIIMPNHLHMILLLHNSSGGRTLFAPTLSRVIKQMKESVTKQVGFSIWQKSFFDHIIRNEQEYREIWEYIDTNPLKWELDRYYTGE